MSWKYDQMTTGSCPSMYNWVNKNVQSFDGYSGVTYRKYGVHTHKKKLHVRGGHNGGH
jgi:hypothetical protein